MRKINDPSLHYNKKGKKLKSRAHDLRVKQIMESNSNEVIARLKKSFFNSKLLK
jgi:hypothetical protein